MIYLVELFKLKEASGLATTWKVSKYGVIFGPYLDTSHSSTKWIWISLSTIKSHAGLWKLQKFLNLPSKLVMEKWKAGGTIMIYIWMELILCISASKLLAWINFHKLTSIVIQKTPSRILMWVLHGSNSAIEPKCLWKGRTISTQKLYHLRHLFYENNIFEEYSIGFFTDFIHFKSEKLFYLSCSKIFHFILEPYLEKQIS